MSNRLFASLLLFTFFRTSLAQAKCTLNHSTVEQQDGLELQATFANARPGNDYDGYYSLTFGNGTLSNVGTVRGWCVDLGRRISQGTYSADVYSSMDPNAPFSEIYNSTVIANNTVVDKPENLPAINWLLNEYPSGSMITIPDCTGTDHIITDQEFQLAVWNVIDDDPNPNSFWTKDNFQQCVVDYLFTNALNSTNYELDCSDTQTVLGVLIIVDMGDYNEITKQVFIAELNLLADTDICSPDCYNGGGEGDPHFQSWSGEHYDYHGVCDLVLVSNPGFGNGVGMDIHIRTERTRSWSYISNAAIRIGEDILEVRGGNQKTNFWINGVSGNQEGVSIGEGNDIMSLVGTLSKYPVNVKQINSKHREFVISLGGREKVVVKTWNSFVGVNLYNSKYEQFKDSVGLMGSYPAGMKLARDNTTTIDDLNKFGQEWQVLSSEPKLFQKMKHPQFPERCEIPSNSEMRRRLVESKVSLKDAKKECANVRKDVVDLCVFDVMATNDKSTVGAY